MEKIGEILVQAGKITPEQLNVALKKQKTVAKRLGAVLIEEGFIEGMKIVGDLFEEGKSQLSQIFEASHIVESGIDVLKPVIMSSDRDFCCFGNLVVGM